jgi:hypothetical protein
MPSGYMSKNRIYEINNIPEDTMAYIKRNINTNDSVQFAYIKNNNNIVIVTYNTLFGLLDKKEFMILFSDVVDFDLEYNVLKHRIIIRTRKDDFNICIGNTSICMLLFKKLLFAHGASKQYNDMKIINEQEIAKIKQAHSDELCTLEKDLKSGYIAEIKYQDKIQLEELHILEKDLRTEFDREMINQRILHTDELHTFMVDHSIELQTLEIKHSIELKTLYNTIKCNQDTNKLSNNDTSTHSRLHKRELKFKSISELKQLCKKHNIKGYDVLKKKQLINKLISTTGM